MSYIYSQALVVEYLQDKYSVTELSVQLKENHTHKLFFWQDKTTEHSPLSLFGMKSQLLMVEFGEELLMWSVEDSRAKTLAHQVEVMDSTEKGQDFGQKWRGLLAKYDQDSHSLKTAQCSLVEDSTESFVTLPNWGLMLNGDVFQHPLSAHHITEIESGLLPTPLATDWKGGTSSIRKDRGTQRLDQFRDWVKSIHGLTYPIPEHSEAVMGLPIGHTDLKPLETLKSPCKQQQHSNY